MIEVQATLALPPELSPFWNTRTDAAYRRFNEGAEAMAKDVPEPQAGEIAAAYVDIPAPRGAGNNTDALVVPLPFGRKLDASMYLRLGLLQELMPEPRRIIALPNASLEGATVTPAYEILDRQVSRVQQGDFSPIARRQWAAIENAGVLHCDILGWEQGAVTGAALLQHAQEAGTVTVGRTVLLEPLNTVTRPIEDLLEIIDDQARASNQAIMDSGIQAYARAEGAQRGPNDWRQDGGFREATIRKRTRMASVDPLSGAMLDGLMAEPLVNNLLPVAESQPALSLLHDPNSPYLERHYDDIEGQADTHIQQLTQLFDMTNANFSRFEFPGASRYMENIAAFSLIARMLLMRKTS